VHAGELRCQRLQLIGIARRLCLEQQSLGCAERHTQRACEGRRQALALQEDVTSTQVQKWLVGERQ